MERSNYRQDENTKGVLIWTIWHKGIAINAWEKHISMSLMAIVAFVLTVEESILRRLWHCPHAQCMWGGQYQS